MRILFAHPYHLALDPHERQLMRPYPPLSTLVAAEVARQAGFDVAFYDGMFNRDEGEFQQAVQGADRVVILGDDHSVQMKMCLGRIKSAHLGMVRMARSAGAEVLVGGPDVSDHPTDYLSAGADAATVGDAVLAATQWLQEEGDIKGVHGLRGGGGRRAAPDDLDVLPNPAWDLVDLAQYRDRWLHRHGYWEMNVWTARGCPYRCNWCAKPTWGRSYGVRSPERVAQEIGALRDGFAPDRLWFTDDIFALKPSWLGQFREVLSSPTPFRCLSRVDLLKDPDYAADLAAVGCDEVWVGAESGSDHILRAMDKDCTVEQIRSATTLLHEHGIRIGFFLQLGYPGESVDDVEATVDMVSTLRPDDLGVSVSYPLPRTQFHERVRASMTAQNWGGSMENRPLYQAPYDAAFYGAAKELLRSVHSASQGPKKLNELITRPNRRTARAVGGAAYHKVRIPLMRQRLRALAKPNPQAVPLDW